MWLEEHCQETERLLGDRFEHVHRWLDEFAGTPEYKKRHRKVRHHLEGIEQVRNLWGDKAAEAARIHIIADIYWGESDHFPENEQDFENMGLF